MTSAQKLEELNWIYHTLRYRAGVFLLGHVVDEAKDYSVGEVRAWAGESAEFNRIYQKIYDLIEIRIHGAVKAGELDKALAAEYLKTYYYKPYAALEEKAVAGYGSGKKEIVVRFV